MVMAGHTLRGTATPLSAHRLGWEASEVEKTKTMERPSCPPSRPLVQLLNNPQHQWGC